MPLQRYESELEQGVLAPDAEQRAVMVRLHSIGDDLVRRRNWQPPSRSLFARWTRPSTELVKGVQGLYLWGGVGRGKTHLCDLFFDSVPFEDKTRLHFHRFMQQIHDDMRVLEGTENPLDHVADQWATRSRLLLLDEIHVNDITDAMLLGGLLMALFERGVTLVTTSNVPPDDLYKDGLQRARFLPAIAQIRKHTNVVEMIGETDYRLQLLQTQPIYLISDFIEGHANEKTVKKMLSHYERLRTESDSTDASIEINGRSVPVIKCSGELVWFSFDALCNSSRSTQDYIEIASRFQTIMISDIPQMGKDSDDAARRFVNLIDELYDRHIKLIVSAEVSPENLYTGQRLDFEFDRAASRLFEMQSSEYLAAASRGSQPGSDHES